MSTTFGQLYPTQKAVAFKVTYPHNWKPGNAPARIKLGSVMFPVGEGIEDGEAHVRRAFPESNMHRLFDERGQWFCSSC